MNGKGTILIIEDQEGFRDIYEDVLTNEGYEVLTAEDGLKGWELSKSMKPNLVLLDLGLPKMDGFEVLQKMRSDEATKSIPVIIFSVMGEHKDIQKAMSMGANDYTVKGFYTPRQILSKIKGLIDQTGQRESSTTYKIGVNPLQWDLPILLSELGLTADNKCRHCGSETVMELSADYVRDGGHWFTARLICSKCEKAF